MPLTKRQQQGAESREQILDAAERLMGTRGVTGTSMSALIETSGLPASSIYWHFGSKDGVLVAVMERGAERFFSSLAPIESFTGSRADRVRAQLDDTAGALEEHGDFLRLLLTLVLLGSEGNAAASAMIAGVRRTARERIEAMLAVAGGPSLAPQATSGLADFVLAAIDGAFIGHLERRTVDLHVLLAQLSRAISALVRDARSRER